MKKKIPKFKNEAEERLFWQKHDSSEYVDWFDAKNVVMPKLDEAVKSCFQALQGHISERNFALALSSVISLPDALANEAVMTLVPECPLKSLVGRFAAISLVT